MKWIFLLWAINNESDSESSVCAFDAIFFLVESFRIRCVEAGFMWKGSRFVLYEYDSIDILRYKSFYFINTAKDIFIRSNGYRDKIK